MHVSVILDRKGAAVHTIEPDATISQAAAAMETHNVGALVVSTGGQDVAGIISERDIVRHLPSVGGPLVRRPVSDIMSTEVTTCTPQTTVDDLMVMMTEQRIRHVPVLDEGVLVGIVSIGDVVKNRLHELEVQAESLEDYITGSHS